MPMNWYAESSSCLTLWELFRSLVFVIDVVLFCFLLLILDWELETLLTLDAGIWVDPLLDMRLPPHRIVASPKMACTSRHLGLIVLVACGLYQLLHGTAILQVRIFRCVDLVQLWLVLSSPGCTIYT